MVIVLQELMPLYPYRGIIIKAGFNQEEYEKSLWSLVPTVPSVSDIYPGADCTQVQSFWESLEQKGRTLGSYAQFVLPAQRLSELM